MTQKLSTVASCQHSVSKMNAKRKCQVARQNLNSLGQRTCFVIRCSWIDAISSIFRAISNLYILLKSALKMQEMPFQRPKFQKISRRACPQPPLELCCHYGLPLTKGTVTRCDFSCNLQQIHTCKLQRGCYTFSNLRTLLKVAAKSRTHPTFLATSNTAKLTK